MNCKDINKTVIKFLDKELTPEQECEFNEHLNECKECSAMYSSIEVGYNSLNIVPEIEPKAFFTERVLNKIDNQKTKESIFDVTVEIAISKFFKGFAYTGVAFIIALFILLYTTDNLFLFNNAAEDEVFTSNRISTAFFDNN